MWVPSVLKGPLERMDPLARKAHKATPVSMEPKGFKGFKGPLGLASPSKGNSQPRVSSRPLETQ
jgi:hypothetical protein